MGDRPVLITPTSKYGSDAVFSGFRTNLVNNEPLEMLFFEVWSDNTFSDELLGGFAVFPDFQESPASKPILWDTSTEIIWEWESRSTRVHRGLASVQLQIVPLAVDAKGESER